MCLRAFARDCAEKLMPATVFLLRAVAPPLREEFDHWYATDHLPWAICA
jgi:hypothetical protein